MSARLSKHLAVIALAALAACGGSSSSPTANAVTYGVITGSGLTVNGTSFTTASASVVGDAIAPGRVARVTSSGSEAIEVRIEPVYVGHAGPRTDSALGGTIDVRGQKIAVDDSTHIEDFNGSLRLFSGINSDGRIAVYGFADDSGVIHASRVDILHGSIDDFQLKGFVSNAAGDTFDLAVTPGAPALAVKVGAGVALPQNGWYVEVHSPTASAGTPADPIIADRVTREDASVGANLRAEVEGIVVSGDGNSFVIAGTTVETSTATTFENGVKTDILPGVKVEAQGSLDSAGVLHATKVSLRSNLRLTGVPSNIVAEAGGSRFQLLGFTVHADPFTDGGPVNTTDAFEVRGRLHSNGTDLVAERIVNEGAQTRIFVQGPVSNPDPVAKTFQILGINVNASAAVFQDIDDAVVSADVFFAGVGAGTVVKARGDTAASLSGGTLTADEASIEGGR